MKATLLIVLVIGIVGITSVGLLITIDYLQNFEYPSPGMGDLITDDDKPDCAVIWPSVYGTSNCKDYDNDKPEPIKIKVTRQPGSVVIPDNINVPLPFGSDPQKQKESEELWRLASENINFTIYNEEGIMNLDLMVKQLHEYCEINYLPACKDLPIINLNESYP